MSYKLFEYFPDLLIYPAKEINQSNIESLKGISEKHNANWIVNLKEVEFLIIDAKNSVKVNFQLYNQKYNQILLEKEVIVGDSNPGFEFACESGTINCVISNSVSIISAEIISTMGKDKKYWR